MFFPFVSKDVLWVLDERLQNKDFEIKIRVEKAMVLVAPITFSFSIYESHQNSIPVHGLPLYLDFRLVEPVLAWSLVPTLLDAEDSAWHPFGRTYP